MFKCFLCVAFTESNTFQKPAHPLHHDMTTDMYFLLEKIKNVILFYKNLQDMTVNILQ